MNPEYRLLFLLMLTVSIMISGPTTDAFGQADVSIVINEFMTSNTNTLSDEDGEYPDWIELYNNGNTAVSLEGYTLSDDPENISKWELPTVSVPAGGYLTVFASDKDRTQLAATWETVVTLNDVWRYILNTSSVPSNWREASFDESGWYSGASGIGTLPYAIMGGTTISITSPSCYMRTTFTIDNLSNIAGAALSMDYQSGFVAYLNGVEIARGNMGTPGIPPTYDDRADSNMAPMYYQGITPPTFFLEDYTDILTMGENVLAVEVHRSNSLGHLFSLPFLSFALHTLPDEPNGTPEQLGLEDIPLIAHTNFKLDVSGETIVLANPLGTIADSVTFGSLDSDRSYGRSPDGAYEWLIFTDPTPGAANSRGYLGYTDATVAVSVPHGFHTSSQSVTLTTNAPGATIHYTTDGSIPDSQSSVYESPIVIDTTTVIRALVIEDGYLPGPVLTKTYIIDEASTIPVVSLTIKPDDLWDNENGIYVEGTNGILGGYPDAPVTPVANWNQEWEKPVHVEFFEADGISGFETDAGARIHGKQNRRLPQKSFAIFFRSEYGLNELDYPLFPGDPITTFKSFILRNSGHDWEATHMRDLYSQSLFEPLDIENQNGRPTHVYLNGVYWGILNLRDKINEDFLETHTKADPNAVDILDDYHIRFTQSGIYQAHPMTEDATTWTCYVTEGTADHFNALLEYMVNHDESDQTVYEYIKTQMDVENFADYMISRIFIADPDGPGHNTKLWRPQTPDGRWRWLMYDTDFGTGLQDSPFGVPGPAYRADIFRYYTRTVQSSEDNAEYSSSRSPDANFLLYSLLGNDDHAGNQEFRTYFANRYADLLNTILSQEVITSKLADLKAVLEPEMERHIDRWKSNMPALSYGTMTSMSEWSDNVSKLETFAKMRTLYARENLCNELDLGAIVSLTVNNANPEAGTIRLNTLTITAASFTGKYFTKVPVYLTVTPRSGYRFIGWQGTSTSTESAITVNLSGTTTLTAIFEVDATATNTLVINEICYNDTDENPCDEWVELLSTYVTPLDVSGWKFMDSDDNHVFTLPNGTVIEAGGYLVISSDIAAFRSVFPDVENSIGSFGFGLSSNGELIRLYDNQGELVDSLTYGADAPWPTEANGTGPTLELSDPSLDNALSSSWEISEGYGTPGVANDTPVAVADTDESIPTTFSLGRNYPNPFNPVTTIPFELPIDAMVTVEVYNTLGQLVAVPVKGRLLAGYHSVQFDASELPSGILFYRLTAGTFTANGRMLLLK